MRIKLTLVFLLGLISSGCSNVSKGVDRLLCDESVSKTTNSLQDSIGEKAVDETTWSDW